MKTNIIGIMAASAGLLVSLGTNAQILFEETFSGAAIGDNNFSNTVNGVYFQIPHFQDNDTIPVDGTDVVAGLDYGNLGGVGRTPTGNSVFNNLANRHNRFRLPEAGLTINEGETVYFSALIAGTKRSNFGFFNYTGAFEDNWEEQIALGLNTQMAGGYDANRAAQFDGVWYNGTTLQKGDDTADTISVANDDSGVRLVLGRIINNAGATNDVMEYHIIRNDSGLSIQETFSAVDLDGGGDDAEFYSKSDYDFGGSISMSNFNFAIQNNSGIDEIVFGQTYDDVISPEADAYNFTATPDVVDANDSSVDVTLAWDAVLLTNVATYSITADKAVSFPGGDDTGTAVNGSNSVDVVVNGTLGDVEFTLIVDNAGAFFTNTAVVAAVPFAPALTSTLFLDTFDRFTGDETNDWNVSASKTGVSGDIVASLPATNFWLETHQNANISETNSWSDSCMVIATNAGEQVCGMCYESASSMGLDHNFIDAAILTDGGFSLSLDVAGWLGTDTSELQDRFVGFGLGLSHDEILALDDDSRAANDDGPRGCLSRTGANAVGSGTADLWVGLSRYDGGVLHVMAKGTFVEEIPVSDEVGNIRFDFGVSDFNAGSFVAYKVYFDDMQSGEGFFRWDADNENYICISARSGAGVDIDNVTIGTVSVPFTAPLDLVDTTATIDLSGGFSNIVVTADAVSNVVTRVDIVQGSLIYNADEWQVLTEAPNTYGKTSFNYDANTNITLNIDATAYGWTNDPPQGYIRIKPVGWKIPTN